MQIVNTANMNTPGDAILRLAENNRYRANGRDNFDQIKSTFSMKKQAREEGKSKEEPKKATSPTRYSDEELKEFRQLVMTRLEEARIDYTLLRETLSRKDDSGTDDTSPVFKLAEEANDIFSKEETAQLAIRRQKYIEQLQNALVRIENKTYGICRITGKLIAKERLRSVPHTTLSIDAKVEAARSN
jgi:DnaK suppressor protein